MIEFKLPDIGEGIAEGEIVKWLVAEGATVAEHEPIVEVMTDKATVEIPAPAAGVVAKLLAAEGDTVPVGQVIFHLDTGGSPAGAPPAGDSARANAPAPASPRASAPAPASPRASAPAPEPAPASAPAPEPARASAPAPAASGGGRTIEFRLPDIGEGIAEGEIVQWLVQEGATVEEHQAIVEVMTDKATVEVPAPAEGTVTKLLASAGDTVPVGQVIFHLATAGGAPAAVEADRPARTPAPERAPAPSSAAAPAPAAAARSPQASAKVVAVPSARRVARELGIDLGRVPGSGRNGVVRRADVEAFARELEAAPTAAPAPQAPERPRAPAAPAAPAPATAGEQRTPFRGVRRKIAEAMVRSKSTAAHFTVVEEVDVTRLVELRGKAKAIGAESGVNVTFTAFIMKAAANGLARFRMLNGRLDEEAQEIVNPAAVHLGVATDTPNGLIVPVVRDAQAKGTLQLAAELQDVVARTREGKVTPDELRGSTFTITNAGNIGGTLATPIINFPDIAILGVHRIVKRPGVVETPEGDQIAVRQFMNLSCSVDHRLADGADAARFLAYLRVLLEDPGLLAL